MVNISKDLDVHLNKA
ncbi:hypothetical protein TIFTF001_048345 [Ficus carica]|nr:hypothetical protein TIFTF001_048345 [Ficus carica]